MTDARLKRSLRVTLVGLIHLAILHGLIENEDSVDQIVARGFDRATVSRVQRLLYSAEYKRRQAPPGVKITRKSFGRDRRYPMTNAFRE